MTLKEIYETSNVLIHTTIYGKNYGAKYDFSAHIMPKDEDDSYWISSPTEAKLIKRIKSILKKFK